MEQIRMMNIDAVKPYENNPRKNDKAVDAVAASIKEFGFKQPIVVDKDMVIIVGHTRLKAARKLGMKEVPVLVADDLTPEQVKAYRLADNKTAELADWDISKLGEELNGIFDIDMSSFGFDMSKIEEAEAVDDGYEGEPPKDPITKKGEVWKLGAHRIMCGDATNPDDVKKLLGGGAGRPLHNRSTV
jgi:ParB-like chromosome segregation protein Spo0J